MTDNRYVYGMVSNDDAIEFETDAVGTGNRVYPISHRRTAALVSDIDTTDPPDTDENTTRHDDVLREIMDRDGGRAIVPMQFGMAFESERELKNVLRRAGSTFRRALNDVENAAELGVKIVRDEGVDVDEDAIEAKTAEVLHPLSEAVVENDLFTDRLVLNHSYLVDHNNREAFGDGVETLESNLEDVQIRYTGPFAPYSFVDIHIGARQ